MSEPRVVIVDDHALFRAGVRAELDGLVDVVGDAGSVGEAVASVLELEPDVVLLDVQMPDGGGAEVIRGVAPQRPAIQFLALSVSDAPDDVISIKSGSDAETTVRVATELISTVPPWLQADHDSLTAKVLRLPERDEIDSPVSEQLIVELYSK